MPAVAACEFFAELELIGVKNTAASSRNKRWARNNNDVATDKRVEHVVVAEVMCHNVERLSNPGCTQQVQQHSIRKLGVLANRVPLQNLRRGLSDFTL